MGDLDAFKAKYGPGSEINNLTRSIRINKEALKKFNGTEEEKLNLQNTIKGEQKRLTKLMGGD